MAFSHSSPLALLLLLFLLLVTLREISGAFDYSPEDLRSERRLADLFERWILHHGKVYKDDDNNNNNKLGTIVSLEKVRRFHIFKRNLRFIHAHNEGRLVGKGPGSRSYRLGLNHFADLTHEEFKASYLGFNFGPHQEKVKVDSPMKDHGAKYDEVAEVVGNSKLPKSMDWREHGAVTPIKNQGSCGSCWAFSTIGAIEGAHAIATGTLISLSEQELVSCDHHNAGCRGGFMDDAFKWVMKNGGINTEEGYPYMSGGSRTHMCRIFRKLHKVVKIDGYKDVPPNDEYMLQHAVSQQPISVAINAGTPEFQFYAGGVFSDGCSDDPNSIDHAVLVVGWGSTSDGEDYWIVKNSWSEEWGLKGYIHMKRGTGKVRGTCGIHTIPSYPIIKQASGIFEENNNLAMATS